MSDQSKLDDSELPRGRFLLTPGVVDVWSLPIGAPPEIVEQLRQVLAPDECERANRFRFEEHRALFVAGRAILRILLSCYVAEDPGRLVFLYGTKGKPSLRDYPRLHFNLGHSGNRAVYAVAATGLGIDIELIKPAPDWKKISRRFFSAREVEDLETLEAEQQISAFFCCWTRKEAYLKATGDGISTSLDRFYAGALPSHARGAIEEDGKAVQWFFKDLKLDPDYAAAIVTGFADPDIRMMQFNGVEDCMRFVESKKQVWQIHPMKSG
jgi:4'-phosphopantetheinyl transferase